MKPTILVIDDDSEIRYSLNRVLASKGYAILSAASGEEGIEVAERSQPHVILLDNRMGGISGIETLQHIRSASPSSMVILMTAYGTTQTAIEAMKFGAFDYIIKPFSPQKILQIIENASKARADLEAAGGKTPSRKIDPDDIKEGIVGQSESMQEVFKMIGQVAASDATVLVTGESGTGKELVARAIYRHSHRSGASYLAVNCAAIPENLIESELFGHEKGVFTGATSRRVGRFEDVGAGTLFLDEIGSMELSLQPKLLRAVQEMEFSRVGSAETIPFRGRIVAATARDLETAVAEGEFREDLFFRLNVIVLTIPPLRQRKEDLPLLIDHFLARGSRRHGKDFQGVSAAVMTAFESHSWPGNVRELENSLERMMVLGDGEVLGVDLLPPTIANLQSQLLPVGDGPFQLPREGLILEDLERSLIEQALQRTGGSLDPAAKMLGISYKTLQYRIKKYRLKKENGLLSEEIIPGEGRIA